MNRGMHIKLTEAQIRALRFIAGTGPGVRISRPTVDALTKAGLVNQVDRVRYVAYELTDKGRDFAARMG